MLPQSYKIYHGLFLNNFPCLLLINKKEITYPRSDILIGVVRSLVW